MVELFEKASIPMDRLQVKLFGGAIQMKNSNPKNDSVGMKNIIKAIDLIENRSLSISSIDVGGGEGRKIHLLTSTGEVLLTRLKNSTIKL